MGQNSYEEQAPGEGREDDGHTIADMSGVPQGLPGGARKLFGRLSSHEKARFAEQEEKNRRIQEETEESPRPWEDNSLSPKERWICALGALKAALLIGGAYIAGLGAVILLLLFFWNRS